MMGQTIDEETPRRKRKRETRNEFEEPEVKPVVEACFTNAAFNFATPPKRITARRRRLQYAKDCYTKENVPVMQLMEIKSVKDIVCGKEDDERKKASVANDNHNPFEVVRKPPKKKKRQIEVAEGACFENAALNLEMPEKQFNPFEVQRPALNTTTQCFVNEALNIRGAQVPATRNPFEIERVKAKETSKPETSVNNGIENEALEEENCVQPSNLKIALPFKPSLGCRIDFKNLPLTELTPSKLLAEKLVFSPAVQPKRSLGSIKEESSTDIGEELDRYQLELENSINEAKLRKNVTDNDEQFAMQHKVRLEERLSFTQKLTEIIEVDEQAQENYIYSESKAEIIKNTSIEYKELEEQITLLQAKAVAIKEAFAEERKNTTKSEITNETKENFEQSTITATYKQFPEYEQNQRKVVEKSNDALTQQSTKSETELLFNGYTNDVAYASESDNEDDDDIFKVPTTFVRNYRRDVAVPTATKHSTSKDAINSNNLDSSAEQHKKSLNVKGFIRRSLRKLMHPIEKNSYDMQSYEHFKEHDEKPPQSQIMSSIRNSLRRKNKDKN